MHKMAFFAFILVGSVFVLAHAVEEVSKAKANESKTPVYTGEDRADACYAACCGGLYKIVDCGCGPRH